MCKFGGFFWFCFGWFCVCVFWIEIVTSLQSHYSNLIILNTLSMLFLFLEMCFFSVLCEQSMEQKFLVKMLENHLLKCMLI